jgi:hypothetical protein
LDEEYKKLILHEGEVDKLILDGFIEEIDFNNVILGHENKDDDGDFLIVNLSMKICFKILLALGGT